jgi:hypothetical protein
VREVSGFIRRQRTCGGAGGPKYRELPAAGKTVAARSVFLP